jgi:hypothetical protein
MLYIIMNLMQLERMKSELKRRFDEQNKVAGTLMELSIDLEG